MNRAVSYLAMLSAAVALAPQPLTAGTLRGQVRDPDGEPALFASVHVLGATTRQSSTGESGSFELELPPGEYTVVVIWDWRTSWALEGIEIRREGATELAVELERSPRRRIFSYPEATGADLDQYRKLLAKMEEPPFCSTPAAGETYRFLWLRSFHAPVLAQVVRAPDGDVRFEYKRLEGALGEEGPIAEHKSGSVLERLNREPWAQERPEQVAAALEADFALADEGFWQQPYLQVTPGMISVDGARWLVEGRRDGRCHFVERDSPERRDPFRRFAELILFHFADQRFYYDEVY